jgi:hypothetical protein
VSDPLAHHPAVDLELGLTLATAATDAAHLPRQVRPPPGEPRQHVRELGQLHLGAGLTGAGPLEEYLEDQGTAVVDLELENPLQVLYLAGREIVVEDDQVGAELAGGGLDLGRLAAADEGAGVGARPALDRATHHLDTGRAGQLGQLVQMLFGDIDGCGAEADADEQGAALVRA